jgi:hypothetical protein
MGVEKKEDEMHQVENEQSIQEEEESPMEEIEYSQPVEVV